MNRRFTKLTSAIGTLLLALATGACGPTGGDDGVGGIECAADLLPGDLVITEIMGNPTGGDDGNEWFEIYNVTGAEIDLTGVILEYRSDPDDETSGSVHQVVAGNGATAIASSEYFVFGGVLAEFAPAYVDYGYGDAFNFGNSDARRLALYCDGEEIDSVTYTSVSDGEATALSNLIFPDHIENNDWENNWCVAVTEYATENLGTPGTGNDCGEVAFGNCLEGDVPRPTVAPQVGDLIITEVMPNPAAVADADGEWFEVLVTAEVDLNGVSLGRDPTEEADDHIDGNECLRVAAGTYVLFAKNADTATNGNLPAADVEYGFSLVNSNGQLFVGYGEQILDAVTWPSSSSGASINLDPGSLDPVANDELINFCTTTDANPYGDGDHGTPGAANEDCPIVIPDGMCMDTVMGAVRPIVLPVPGELTITEFLANPDIIGDTDGEWIEIRANADVDLNDVEVRKLTDTGTADSSQLVATECLRVTAGSYAVITRDTDPLVNGCINPAFGPDTPVFDVSLNNSNNTVYLTADGTDIDSVHYAGTSGGSSESLDEGTGMWCPNQSDVYDTCLASANTGTPGMANPGCP